MNQKQITQWEMESERIKEFNRTVEFCEGIVRDVLVRPSGAARACAYEILSLMQGTKRYDAYIALWDEHGKEVAADWYSRRPVVVCIDGTGTLHYAAEAYEVTEPATVVDVSLEGPYSTRFQRLIGPSLPTRMKIGIGGSIPQGRAQVLA